NADRLVPADRHAWMVHQHFEQCAKFGWPDLQHGRAVASGGEFDVIEQALVLLREREGLIHGQTRQWRAATRPVALKENGRLPAPDALREVRGKDHLNFERDTGLVIRPTEAPERLRRGACR